IGSKDDRARIARRILGLLSSVPWELREDVEKILARLGDEAAFDLDEEISRRMKQPEEVRVKDSGLRVLLKVRGGMK
ncbi:MAG: hypothetical protein ACP5SH_25945, partial [Syntrophobacteraceae bacterium]